MVQFQTKFKQCFLINLTAKIKKQRPIRASERERNENNSLPLPPALHHWGFMRPQAAINFSFLIKAAIRTFLILIICVRERKRDLPSHTIFPLAFKHVCNVYSSHYINRHKHASTSAVFLLRVNEFYPVCCRSGKPLGSYQHS